MSSNVVITEAHSVFGLKFVKILAHYYRTFALCPNPEDASELQDFSSENSNVHIIKADMTNFNGYQTVKDEIQQNIDSGGVNLLVNNMGMMIKDNIETMRRESTQTSLEINAVAPLVLFTKALVPLFKDLSSNKFGMTVLKPIVLNISPYLEPTEKDNEDYFSYRLSKASVKMVTKSLSMELESQGIFVMAFDPGWVNTNFEEQPGEGSILNSVDHKISRILYQLRHDVDDSTNGCLVDTQGHKIEW